MQRWQRWRQRRGNNGGSAAAAVAEGWRQWAARQQGCGNSTAAVIARWRRWRLQRGGGGQLGSAASSAAALRREVRWQHGGGGGCGGCGGGGGSGNLPAARRQHVSIQKIRSVPYRYGELLALLVYLTWLLHRGPGFVSLVVPWRKVYHSQRGTNMYVAAPLLVHVS